MQMPTMSVIEGEPRPTIGPPAWHFLSSTFFPQVLEKVQNISIPPRGRTSSTYEDFELAMMQALSTLDPTPHGHEIRPAEEEAFRTSSSQALTLLAAHLYDALLHEDEYSAVLFEVLAVASRSPPFRSYFSPQDSQGQDQHNTLARAEEPDCVLEVARRVATLSYGTTSAVIKSALKIIANCCATVAEGCELIVRRKGLESLLQLSRHDTDLNTLVPTLFNACSEFVDEAQYTPPHTEHPDLLGEEFVSPVVSEILAAAHRSNPDFATFELLLSFSEKVERGLWGYLTMIIAIAIRPVIRGFEQVRQIDETEHMPWTWSFTIDGQVYDTIALVILLRDHDECDWYMSIMVSYLLSQQQARDALLRREDDSIWTLCTFACGSDRLPSAGSDVSSDYVSVRQALLKTLYQITGDPSFCQNDARKAVLIERTTNHLASRLQDGKGGRKFWLPSLHGTGQSFRNASACVILSQLAASDSVREQLCAHHGLHEVLSLLLSTERNPDVLYPAVTIVSRLALSPRKQLLFEEYHTLKAMQRLLTGTGLGLTVPFETVTSYKTACRGRPAVSVSLLRPGSGGENAVVADVLALWNLTIEVGTKAEIGKLFLEILRSMVSIYKEDGSYSNTEDEALAIEFETALGKYASFAARIAEVFAWLCTSAEPASQRVHGWFGLAMLSIWKPGRQSILPALEQHQLTEAIANASNSKDGPIPNNLKLMLNNIQSASFDQVPASTRDVLRTAASNLGLRWPPQ